jgi:hypothetical protein
LIAATFILSEGKYAITRSAAELGASSARAGTAARAAEERTSRNYTRQRCRGTAAHACREANGIGA